MSDYNLNKLKIAVNDLRLSFLKRKNIANWKRLPKETPGKLSKLINAFDRKINNIEIFDYETKKKYFKKLNELFEEYYEEEKYNKCSKHEAWIHYRAESYCNKFPNLYKISKKDVDALFNNLLTFKEFKKSGICNKYKY